MGTMTLDERSRHILKAVIESYISTADPVGSLTVTKKYSLPMSPATVRHVMADLEERGYLSHPHTSAGRIPTDKGYRFYVNTLLYRDRRTEIGEDTLAPLRAGLEAPEQDRTGLFQVASQVLSELSRYAGVVTATWMDAVFRHIELIRLRERLILAVFVTDAGGVQHKLLRLQEDCSQAELDRLTEFLSMEPGGLTLSQIRQRLLERMQRERALYTQLMGEVLRAIREVADDKREVYLVGMTKIMDFPEFANLERLKAVMTTFEEKAGILKILDRCLDADGVQVFIGSETASLEKHGCSLVVARYRESGRAAGTLGVIGPTRMPYAHVIPMVDSMARLISRILTQHA
ncbi:MAG: heat-inducible transcription repressor HrcA [Nitrospirae bacterium]|nr:heat-inducible transcription repressor HrcA [Nitrospirota bacterium]